MTLFGVTRLPGLAAACFDCGSSSRAFVTDKALGVTKVRASGRGRAAMPRLAIMTVLACPHRGARRRCSGWAHCVPRNQKLPPDRIGLFEIWRRHFGNPRIVIGCVTHFLLQGLDLPLHGSQLVARKLWDYLDLLLNRVHGFRDLLFGGSAGCSSVRIAAVHV